MRTTSSPTPRRAAPGRRDVAAGGWPAALPLALAAGLLTGCTAGTAATGPAADPAPTPGTVRTVPATAAPEADAPQPTASRTPGTVTTVAPAAPALSPAARAALEGLVVAAAGTMSDYDRESLFGGWVDADGDCEDTRNEVLARDLTGVTSRDGCTVDAGTLADPYTGTTVDFVRGAATSQEVQVDHVVSLGNAWATGARRLSPAERVDLANDPLNLLAVGGSANGAKSDLDASRWLPPHEASACATVAVQIAVKSRYGLWVTAPEKAAMAEVLSACPDQPLPGGAPFGDVPGGAAPAPVAPSPVPAPAGRADVHYADCAAARQAGAAPVYRGEPGYRDTLDGDADGVACEA